LCESCADVRFALVPPHPPARRVTANADASPRRIGAGAAYIRIAVRDREPPMASQRNRLALQSVDV
jgi:hypothetical protein